MSDVHIVGLCRTPIGAFKGQFSNISAVQLGKVAIQETVKRSRVPSGEIDEIYLGCVLTAGKGQNPARQAAVESGIPIEVPAITINMLCGSGLKSVALGYNSIKAGSSKIVLAGGMESMTQAEHTIYMRSGIKLGDGTLKDTMLCDGLTDAFHNIHMGKTAEEVAAEYKIPREQQDEYALRSQQKTAKAMQNKLFDAELIGVLDPKTKQLITVDEHPRSDTTLQTLAALRPVFVKENGTVTAGNASGINDGAAAVMLVSGEELQAKNLTSLAKIIGYAEAGINPKVMGIAPITAIRNLMKKINWTLDQVDLFEINEAFASQSIAIVKELNLDESKVNVTGGAIALGHPIGASGARVLVTLVYNMKRLGLKRGVVSLCVGGGMGIAMAIEM